MEAQIAKQEARTRFANDLAAQQQGGQPDANASSEYSTVPFDQHHKVPDSQKDWIDLPKWYEKNRNDNHNDPALKVISLPLLSQLQLTFI